MVIQVGVETDRAKRIRLKQGEAIRSTRLIRQLSVDELAEAVKVSPGAIRHWETGRYTPRQQHQLDIATALGVPWGVLFALNGEAA